MRVCEREALAEGDRTAHNVKSLHSCQAGLAYPAKEGVSSDEISGSLALNFAQLDIFKRALSMVNRIIRSTFVIFCILPPLLKRGCWGVR